MGQPSKNIRQSTLATGALSRLPADRAHIPPNCREVFLPTETPAWGILSRRGMNSAGISQLQKGYEIIRGNPHFHLDLFCLGGRGELCLPTPGGAVNAGMRLSVAAGTPCHYRVPRGPWNIVWFHFTPGPGDWILTPSPHPLVPAVHGAELEAAMSGLIAQSRRTDGGSEEAATLHARLILNHLEREHQRDGGTPRAVERVAHDRLWLAVQEEPAKPWTVETLARGMGLSVTYYRRRVHELYGASPQEMVARIRMSCAMDLMRAGIGPQRVVAERVGYGNEFTFSTAFKRESGKSPRDWQKWDAKRQGGMGKM